MHINEPLLRRIKEKLNVMTSQVLWETVYARGLIHLLALSLDALPADDRDLCDTRRK